MGNLDEQIIAELREISRFGFEARWTRYWPLVFEIVETDPEAVVDVRDSIVEIEERIAQGENRPTLDRLLGDQRAVWQEEAKSVFAEFIQPFINAEGTSAERQALYAELQQVRQDVKHKIEATERAKAYPEYVLALDYVAAFASTASLAFSGKDAPAARTAPVAQTKPAHNQTQAPPPPQEPVAKPEQAAAPEPQSPAPSEMDLRAPQQDAPKGQELPQVPPIAKSATNSPSKPRRPKRVGLIVTAITLVLLLAAAAATFVMKPDLIDFQALFEAVFEDNSFDTAVDEFMSRTASACPLSEEDLTVAAMMELEPCVETAKKEALESFKMLLSQGGGTWSQSGGVEEWTAPEGERNDKLMLAWEQLRALREAYDDQVTQAVITYDGQFYPPDEERDAQGWRFAIWLCTCNDKAELVEVDDPARTHRVFISSAELVTTPHTYNTLVGLLRDYFLGGEKLGNPDQVALTVEQFDLPHGLTAGPRLGGPFSSRRDTEDAIDTIKSFYEALGFTITDIDLR